MTLDFTEMMKREIQKLHSIETQLVDALKALSAMAQSQDLKQALEMHRGETETHVQRIEQIASKMGWNVIGIPSKTLKAMQMETLEMLTGAEPSPLTDAMIIAAAQQSEHLEMAAYGTARTLAKHMGDQESASLLQQTLDEEKRADEKLTQIAEAGINQSAASLY